MAQLAHVIPFRHLAPQGRTIVVRVVVIGRQGYHPVEQLLRLLQLTECRQTGGPVVQRLGFIRSERSGAGIATLRIHMQIQMHIQIAHVLQQSRVTDRVALETTKLAKPTLVLIGL